MNRTCTQCNFDFLESTISYYRRLKNESPIICQSCNRINNAEERAAKRMCKKHTFLIHPMEKYVRNPHMKISTTYLQIKYKITFAEAKKWMGRLSEKIG